MLSVAKRDRETVKLRLGRIMMVTKKAFRITGKSYTADIVELLSLRIASDFQEKTKDSRTNMEDIQDSVEKALEESGYTDVVKAYILYRKQREKIRNLNKTILDYKDVIDNYIKVEDWRIKENSTIAYSVDGLVLNNSDAVTASYWLTEMYNRETSGAHINGDIHIHDLSILTNYSYGWSLRKLLLDGLGGITGKITASPVRRLATLCNQMVNFLGIMQNEWVASQPLSPSDTCLAPSVKVDSLSYDKAKKCMEAFAFGVNTPSCWSTQAPSSHIFMDLKVPGDMVDGKAIVDGRRMELTYGDCQGETGMVDRAFLETTLKGDANGLGFQYLIPAYGIGLDYDWSNMEQSRLLFSPTSYHGTPYFVNYMRNGAKPEDIRTLYEGIRSDFHVLRKKPGGFFGYGEHTGSVDVVMINLPRVAYQSKDEKEFFAQLNQMMDLATRFLSVKRKVIPALLKNGPYPYTICYLTGFDSHLSSIDVTDMNEAGLSAPWLKTDLESEETEKFAVSVLNHMHEKLIGYQMERGSLHGLGATPAESATFRFAGLDREHFSEIRIVGHDRDKPYYTDSTELPADCDGTLRDALINRDSLWPLHTTGTVLHVYMEQGLED